MRTRAINSVFRHAAAFAADDQAGVSDGDLARSFRRDGNHAAFAGIVHRHGPMVWGVCRNLLDEADAEDAFQATFLAFVRSRQEVRDPAALGGWLHRVAVRVAREAGRANRRRRRQEMSAAVPETTRPVPDSEWGIVHAAVHSEIDRLPARLRELFVLCCLEGVRPTDAAARLGLKVGSVTGLLSRARQRLLDRLRTKELIPGTLLGVASLVVSSAPAGVPAGVFESTLTLARSDAVAGVSSTVLTLARVATETSMTRTKLLAAVVMIGTALSAGVGGSILSRSMAQSTGNPAPLAPQDSGQFPPATTYYAPPSGTPYNWSKPRGNSKSSRSRLTRKPN
jgi:RNA polymerase sigma factor (sigma-70 family)